jgi:hypothetical protein
MSDELNLDQMMREAAGIPSEPQGGSVPEPAPQTPVQDPTPQEPVQSPQTAPWRDMALTLGYEVPDNATPEQVISMIHGQRAVEAERAQYWEQHYRPQQVEEPAKPAPQDELEQYFQSRWSAPQVKDEWFNLVDRDPKTGMYVSKVYGDHRVASPEIVQKLNEYQAWAQRAPVEFFQNPYKNVYDALQEPLTKRMEQLVTERVQALLSQQEESKAVQRFEEENKSLIYQMGPSGEILRDRQGREVFTDYGQKIAQEVQDLWNGGMRDRMAILRKAKQIVGPPPSSETPSQTDSPVAPVQAPAAAAPAENPNEKFIEKAVKKALSASSHTDTAHPGDGLHVTEAELDNMFLAAIK